MTENLIELVEIGDNVANVDTRSGGILKVWRGIPVEKRAIMFLPVGMVFGLVDLALDITVIFFKFFTNDGNEWFTGLLLTLVLAANSIFGFWDAYQRRAVTMFTLICSVFGLGSFSVALLILLYGTGPLHRKNEDSPIRIYSELKEKEVGVENTFSGLIQVFDVVRTGSNAGAVGIISVIFSIVGFSLGFAVAKNRYCEDLMSETLQLTIALFLGSEYILNASIFSLLLDAEEGYLTFAIATVCIFFPIYCLQFYIHQFPGRVWNQRNPKKIPATKWNEIFIGGLTSLVSMTWLFDLYFNTRSMASPVDVVLMICARQVVNFVSILVLFLGDQIENAYFMYLMGIGTFWCVLFVWLFIHKGAIIKCIYVVETRFKLLMYNSSDMYEVTDLLRRVPYSSDGRLAELITKIRCNYDNRKYPGRYTPGGILDSRGYRNAQMLDQELRKIKTRNLCFLKEYLMFCLREDRHDDIHNIYTTILRLDPKNDDTLWQMGFYFQNQMEFDKARDFFTRCLDANPQLASAHSNMGRLLTLHFDEHELALKHYETALELLPRFPKCKYLMGNVLADHFERYDEAKKWYEECLELWPKFVNAHVALAKLLMNHFDDKKGAMDHISKSLEYEPDNEEVKKLHAEWTGAVSPQLNLMWTSSAKEDLKLSGTVYCDKNHPMDGPAIRTNGWCCDRAEKFGGTGCKSGLFDFDQGNNLKNYRCEYCEKTFYLCELCAVVSEDNNTGGADIPLPSVRADGV